MDDIYKWMIVIKIILIIIYIKFIIIVLLLNYWAHSTELNYLVVIEYDWLLLLEPTNQQRYSMKNLVMLLNCEFAEYNHL